MPGRTEIGPMRATVVIQRATDSQAASGAVTRTWVTLATVWGKLEPLQGRELWQAQQVRAQVSHRVTIRYFAGLDPADRLIVDGVTFSIDGVTNPDGRRRFHECVCIQEL